MNFFAAFDTWLQAQLATFIADKTAALAALIEPFMVTCGVLYIMIWGWLQIAGKIDEQLLEGAKRILILVVIFGFALNLWSYNAFFVDTFMASPRAVAATLATAGAGGVGGAGGGTVAAADTVLAEGGTVAENLLKQGGFLDGSIIYTFVGAGVYLLIIVTAGYAAFLEFLARIALSVILALGPLFLVGLLFDSTRRFFEAWVAQLANYALVIILTGAVVGLLMQIVVKEATDMSGLGTAIQIAQVIPMLVACVLVLLVMRQIMPIAAALSSGVALASMGVVSSALAYGLGRAGRFGRGIGDTQTSRWDPISRKAGYYVGLPLRAALGLGARATGQATQAAMGRLGLSLRPRNEIRQAGPR